MLVLLGALLALASEHVPAASLGMLADNATDRIAVFDADTDRVQAVLEAGPGQALGDCAVSSDQSLGISTGSSSRIAFIQLDRPEGLLASLEISNLGVDMALSPDDSLLVSAGGGALSQPLSVVDVAKREEIAVSRLFMDHTSVEFCDDGTLLVSTIHGTRLGAGQDNALYNARLDTAGQVRLLGGRISSGAQPNNSACAPGSRAGVMLDREGGLTSFSLPGMTPAGQVAMRGDIGISAAFSHDGRRLYVRTATTVEAFEFNPDTGALARDWVREAPVSSTFYGMDQIAIHPHGGKVYVDGGGELLILDPSDGSRFGSISAGDATGVCFASHPRHIEGGGTGRSISLPGAR